MIKRSYFIRAKVGHENGTGLFSWWSGTFVVKSWFKADEKELFDLAMRMALEKISPLVNRQVNNSDVQIVSLNRI